MMAPAVRGHQCVIRLSDAGKFHDWGLKRGLHQDTERGETLCIKESPLCSLVGITVIACPPSSGSQHPPRTASTSKEIT